jgi:hypothetical protein
MGVEWRAIPGFEDYMVSEDGRIRNKNGLVMKTRVDRLGYERINLQKDKKKHTIKVHWAVLSAFQPHNDTKNLTVDHIDGNRRNNHVSNLRWLSLGENLRLQHFHNNDEVLHFASELRRLYSEDALSEILKTLLNLARLLKEGEVRGDGT